MGCTPCGKRYLCTPKKRKHERQYRLRQHGDSAVVPQTADPYRSGNGFLGGVRHHGRHFRRPRRRQRRAGDQSGNGSYWVNAAYEWGYADNFSPIDRLTDDDNVSAAANPNHFRIADAVTFEGEPAGLEYIDFVKVQTGVNAKSGWLGELSTEVFGFYDYRMRRE